eukprot:5960975-Prymnesium_polylepis.1
MRASLLVAVAAVVCFEQQEQACEDESQAVTPLRPGDPVLIVVDDVEDRPLDSSGRCVLSSAASIDDNLVSTQALGGQLITSGSTGSCTLRTALQLASAIEERKVTIALRAGRFRLGEPLPEVRGNVLLVGSAGRSESCARGLRTHGLPSAR